MVSGRRFDNANSLDDRQAGEASPSPFQSFTSAITSVFSRISGNADDFGEPLLPAAHQPKEQPGSMVSVDAISNGQPPEVSGTVIEPFIDPHKIGKATESARLRVTIEGGQLGARFASGDQSTFYPLDPQNPVLDLRQLSDNSSLIVSVDKGLEGMARPIDIIGSGGACHA